MDREPPACSYPEPKREPASDCAFITAPRDAQGSDIIRTGMNTYTIAQQMVLAPASTSSPPGYPPTAKQDRATTATASEFSKAAVFSSYALCPPTAQPLSSTSILQQPSFGLGMQRLHSALPYSVLYTGRPSSASHAQLTHGWQPPRVDGALHALQPTASYSLGMPARAGHTSTHTVAPPALLQDQVMQFNAFQAWSAQLRPSYDSPAYPGAVSVFYQPHVTHGGAFQAYPGQFHHPQQTHHAMPARFPHPLAAAHAPPGSGTPHHEAVVTGTSAAVKPRVSKPSKRARDDKVIDTAAAMMTMGTQAATPATAPAAPAPKKSRKKKIKIPRAPYHCRTCGQLKKGHVCFLADE